MPIYNYGLNWDYSGEAWGRRGRSEPVWFGLQIGIYALYKNKKLVYVGKSGSGKKPNIASRLANHHRNMAGKWNRFSWFGFIQSATEKCKLGATQHH